MSLPESKTRVMDASELEELHGEFEPTEVQEGLEWLGRYTLVYELGSGGMASVYLAYAHGPAGFQRWFAIKRIHRHLARDKRFVDMFLDEARIAASLSHPNVAQVHELSQDGDEYFLAMEYLHGEHLGALAARCARELGRMPAELACHVVARAADGLHHAHEARGPDGGPLALVHRDVSPQNIFVTYDGTVRVMDFGIAKAANRITRTETGNAKGKTAYMAPEQALGHSIDHRVDVFALGVVLWELTVGRRLFKADTPAQTLMRILSGEATPPSRVVPDYPPPLEAIVLRALATAPDQRYPTAAALARDLDRFIASRGVPAGQSELAALTHRLFPDRKQAKDALLASRPGTVSEVIVPSRPSDEDSSAEGAVPKEQSYSAIVTRPVRRAVPWWLWLAPIALVTLLAGVGFGVWAMAPGEATVRIDSNPSGARVRLDGQEAGFTPLRLDELSVGRHELSLSLDGYRTLDVAFDADEGDNDLHYALAGESEPAVASPGEGDGARAPPTVAEAPGGERSEAPASPEEPVAQQARDEAPDPRDEGDRSEGAEPERVPHRTGRRQPATRGHGYLNLVTVPWAEVQIDGRAAGNTPLVRHRLPAGAHRVRLRAQGRGPWRTIRVRIAADQVVSRRVQL